MKPLKLYAPLDGRTIAIENVPDPVFAQKLVGDGIAVDPTSQVLLAPCAGKITQLHSAHHAVTLTTDDGRQVLLHIGLDTVQLKGQGFRPKVKTGDKVKAGQPLIEFDADYISAHAKSLITVMVVMTGAVKPVSNGFVRAGKDTLAEAVAEAEKISAAPVRGSRAESPSIRIALPTGLHARPAAQLVAMAKAFMADVRIHKSGNSASAKSVVGVMGLEISCNDTIQLTAEGQDANRAIETLTDFLINLEEKSADAAPIVKAAARASQDPNVIAGIGVSPGLAIGRVHQIREQEFQIPETSRLTAVQENHELGLALAHAANELGTLREKVKAETDATRAAIFSAHLELLEDPDILEGAWLLISKGKTAAYAWNRTIQEHAERLAHLNNELMAQRANDLRDVGQRVLRAILKAGDAKAPIFESGVILIAENLTPSQTVQLDREKVLGFCTTQGGSTSHVAILARSLGIPGIAGIDAKALAIENGKEIILDAERGEVRLNPSAAEKKVIHEQQEALSAIRKAALAQAAQPAVMRDKRVIEIAANIGSLADAEEAVANGADGVGLLRSEFLFLERDTAPSEDEQHLIYQQIADKLGARPLIIRTLDVGGDKPLKYLPLEPEENPFLGIRGIRIGLLYENVLRTQLRAILRVKSQARMHIMFPMIATLEDWHAAKRILEEERLKLNVERPQVGIMVEVPSVALMAEAFATEVDFFSVGTNDLTQYTLAMDRGHKDLAKQADALHPSVLKLIELTCNAAKGAGKWVGVCGGLAGDSKAVAILIGLGVKELSVSIPSVPLIKAQVRELNTTDALLAAKRAMACRTAREVRSLTTVETNGKSVNGNQPTTNLELN